MAYNDKKGDINQERLFERVAKIPISNTFDELVEMDLLDYVGRAVFLHIQGAFSRFSVVIPGYQEKGRTNGGNGKRKRFRNGCFSGRQKWWVIRIPDSMGGIFKILNGAYRNFENGDTRISSKFGGD